MNLTETWLDSTIKDIVEIEGLNIFRGDRKIREKYTETTTLTL